MLLISSYLLCLNCNTDKVFKQSIQSGSFNSSSLNCDLSTGAEGCAGFLPPAPGLPPWAGFGFWGWAVGFAAVGFLVFDAVEVFTELLTDKSWAVTEAVWASNLIADWLLFPPFRLNAGYIFGLIFDY